MTNNHTKPLVAYFCMEYGLDNSFKLFSGGLGILAGDLIKAAFDEKYPMVAVGILWRQGYTNQTIGENGLPVDSFPEYRYPFLKDAGVTVTVSIRDTPVKCKVWLCDKFNNIPLYLLDPFLPNNPYALISGQLYGWFSEERLAQEIILGIGGVKALKALGIEPDIYHFNEGHAVLAGLELIKQEIGAQEKDISEKEQAEQTKIDTHKQQENENDVETEASPKNDDNPLKSICPKFDAMSDDARLPIFEDAYNTIRNKIIFTTHTPVMAGNEVHDHNTIFYTGANNGFRKHELTILGGDPFNMTVAGLNLSRLANAVAELHAETANTMWATVKMPSKIIAVTNGVHNGTWQDKTIAETFKDQKALWSQHQILKQELVDEIASRNHVTINPNGLIIGFARRAAPYKRSDLIFRDIEKISPFLKSGKIQLVFSGKAHPNDIAGKHIVSNLYQMSQSFPNSVVFLQNYDMQIGKLMTRGCDVWLNNPIRPMEASGTSGMKAAMNGVLNLSVLDGWWPEGCIHDVNGWQIGNGYEGEDHDDIDAESLYQILSETVVPLFYESKNKWIGMMQNSIEMSSEQFSAARMLADYVKKMYQPV